MATNNKVIHVTDEAHAQAKAWCAERNLEMRTWVSSLIERATSGNVVERKPLEQLSTRATVDPADPPFWAK